MAKIEDPIEFELVKNAIFAIGDEMAVTICRTTYSGVLRDNMDFSTALADANGKMVAQGLTLPGHLGSIPAALAVVVERFAGDIHPGDMFILNDPFDGGMHLPDIFIFQPLFHEGKRVAFAATISHHSDSETLVNSGYFGSSALNLRNSVLELSMVWLNSVCAFVNSVRCSRALVISACQTTGLPLLCTNSNA